MVLAFHYPYIGFSQHDLSNPLIASYDAHGKKWGALLLVADHTPTRGCDAPARAVMSNILFINSQ